MTFSVDTHSGIEEMTATDGRAMLNALTHDSLGINVDEFLRRLDAGDYADARSEQVVRLMMLAPFAR